jgi:hypothetical protein
VPAGVVRGGVRERRGGPGARWGPASARTILAGIPVGAHGSVQPSAILLHDDGSHHVLEGLVQSSQVLDAGLQQAAGGSVGCLWVVAALLADGGLQRGLDHLLNVLNLELLRVLAHSNRAGAGGP